MHFILFFIWSFEWTWLGLIERWEKGGSRRIENCEIDEETIKTAHKTTYTETVVTILEDGQRVRARAREINSH